LLCVSSKIGRALRDLHNLLPRQCSTSQMRHARWLNQQPAVDTPIAAAELVASTLTEVQCDGFQFNPPTNTTLTERIKYKNFE
jgi:hypothetical protein